jgi:hypothetical protein
LSIKFDRAFEMRFGFFQIPQLGFLTSQVELNRSNVWDAVPPLGGNRAA